MDDIRVEILILSDKGYNGQREDKSGPALAEMLKGHAVVTGITILPDERDMIAEKLREICDAGKTDIIFTSGGTGFAPRDVTPEATMDVAERAVPGIAEAMRRKSMEITPKAMLSRGAAAIRGKTLIVNLPGSPKAVRECVEVFLPAMDHAVETLRGEAYECAGPDKR